MQPTARISNPIAFAPIFRAHHDGVWRFLDRLGVPPAWVDDATQDVFLIVHRRLDDFEGRSSVRTWVYGIARRIAANYRRRAAREWARRRYEHDGVEVIDPRTPEDWVGQVQAGEILANFVESLEPGMRNVFILSEFEQLVASEIALRLELNVNTVRSRLRGVRIRLDRVAQRIGCREHGQSRPSLPQLARRRNANWCALLAMLEGSLWVTGASARSLGAESGATLEPSMMESASPVASSAVGFGGSSLGLGSKLAGSILAVSLVAASVVSSSSDASIDASGDSASVGMRDEGMSAAQGKVREVDEGLSNEFRRTPEVSVQPDSALQSPKASLETRRPAPARVKANEQPAPSARRHQRADRSWVEPASRAHAQTRVRRDRTRVDKTGDVAKQVPALARSAGNGSSAPAELEARTGDEAELTTVASSKLGQSSQASLESDLELHVESLGQVRAAWVANRSAVAVQRAQTYLDRHPRGVFVEDVTALLVRAQCRRLVETDSTTSMVARLRVSKVLASFRARWPKSALRSGVDLDCEMFR